MKIELRHIAGGLLLLFLFYLIYDYYTLRDTCPCITMMCFDKNVSATLHLPSGDLHYEAENRRIYTNNTTKENISDWLSGT